MRNTLKTVVLALGLMPALAAAQTPNYPQTLPPNTVVGRLGVSAGPSQAIPFSTFLTSVVGSSKITIGSTQIPLGTTAPILAGLTLTSPTINGGIINGSFSGTVSGLGLNGGMLSGTFSGAPVFTGLHSFFNGATLSNSTSTVYPLSFLAGAGQAVLPSTYSSADSLTFRYFGNSSAGFARVADIVADASSSGLSSSIRFFTNNGASTPALAAQFDNLGNLILQKSMNVTSSGGGIYNHGTPSSAITGNNFGGGPPEHYAMYNNIVSAPNSGVFASSPQIGFSNVMNASHGAGDPGVYFVATGSVGTMNPGAAPTWAQTNVLTMYPGVGSYQGTGIEVDFNNWNMNYTPAMAALGHSAQNLILTGTNNDGAGNGGYATAAIVMAFGGSTTAPMWDYGILSGIAGFKTYNSAFISDVSNAPTSILIAGSHAGNIIDMSAATTSGFKINGNQFKVDNIGNEYALTNNATSDARLKHDIVPLPDGALAKLMQLAPKNYVLNSDTTNKLRAHVIAQDLIPLIPEAVVEDSVSGYYAVDDAPILAYSIKAIQELKHANDNLASRVDALERSGAR